MKTPEDVIAEHWLRYMPGPNGIGRSNARNVIEALDAAGYVIVPKEPTEEMKKTAIKSLYGYEAMDDEGAISLGVTCYKNMLAAKP